MDRTSEARRVARSKADELASLSWEELDAYGKHVDRVVGPSGAAYRVRSHVFWDMEPGQSDLHISVSVRSTGWRGLLRVREHRLRRGEDLPR